MSINIAIEGGTSKRLLTAGKYCADDIIVTAEGGGVELDVMTASSLPAAVTDGQIVIITDTTPGTVYIDTDEPASPATGDVWVTLAAEAAVKLELTEESPYLRGGLTAAAQWDGSAWVSRDGYLGVDGAWEQIVSPLPPIGTALNDCTWKQISMIAASGMAKDYFALGDAKEIIINGTVGNTTFNNLSVWAFIIGFDHNSDIEGKNKIHFQLAKTGPSGGTDIALVDSGYGSGQNADGYFTMNYPAANAGGWASSEMRTVLLGSSYNPVSPRTSSLLAALPQDLRMVMKPCVKYSDNTGNGNDTASYVTATTDYLWFLAEYEVAGRRYYANKAEQNYQEQYAYYASGNSKAKYQYNATATIANWWTRSVYSDNTQSFCFVFSTGNQSHHNAGYSSGVAPAFCVG